MSLSILDDNDMLIKHKNTKFFNERQVPKIMTNIGVSALCSDWVPPFRAGAAARLAAYGAPGQGAIVDNPRLQPVGETRILAEPRRGDL